MMLEQCTHDFKSLIERFDILKAFEDAEEGERYFNLIFQCFDKFLFYLIFGQFVTNHLSCFFLRPRSVAWDVRKMSPGKMYTSTKDVPRTSSTSARKLCYNSPIGEM